MKTKVFLAVALVFSLAMMSCGNKKSAETSSEKGIEVCDSICTRGAGNCCDNDSVCTGTCKGTCAGDCENATCPKKTCDKACEK